jgi:hypothetical protein
MWKLKHRMVRVRSRMMKLRLIRVEAIWLERWMGWGRKGGGEKPGFHHPDPPPKDLPQPYQSDLFLLSWPSRHTPPPGKICAHLLPRKPWQSCPASGRISTRLLTSPGSNHWHLMSWIPRDHAGSRGDLRGGG